MKDLKIWGKYLKILLKYHFVKLEIKIIKILEQIFIFGINRKKLL